MVLNVTALNIPEHGAEETIILTYLRSRLQELEANF